MKILLLGASGYVGQACHKHFTEQGHISVPLARRQHDYTRPEGLREALLAIRPDFLVNAAGFTGKPNVDACEQHKTDTLLGNAILPGMLREVCSSMTLPWGHISSGCIYSGRRADAQGFREEDAPNFSFRAPPCSFYSGSKALGEELLEGASACYIWRLRIPFNHVHCRRNYLSKLITYPKLLEAENSVSHLDEFAQAVLASITKRIPYGIYNVTNPGSITTRQVTTWIQEEGQRRQRLGKPNPFPETFTFFSSEAEFMRTAAKTPRSNCVLSTDKLAAAGITLRPVETAIRDALAHWQEA